jgi:hypothetical protein
MHGIKYFFLNKNNQTIQKGAKKISRGETNYRKHYFSKNPGGARAPLDNPGSATAYIPPELRNL